MKEICTLLIFAVLFFSIHTNSTAQESLNPGPETITKSDDQQSEKKDLKTEIFESNALAIKKTLNNELAEARQIFAKNLEMSPGCGICRYNLAWVLMELEQYDKAIETAEPILRSNPDNAKALALLGLLYIKKERYSDSLKCLQQAASGIPEATRLAKIGFVYSMLGDTKKSLSYFDGALKLAPDDAEVLNNRGHVLYLQKRYKEALESLNKALLLQPGQAQIHNNLGAVYEELGKDKKAIESYQEAIRLDANYPDPRYNLGLLYVRKNDRKGAYEKLWQLEKFNSPIAEKLRDVLSGKFVLKIQK